MSAESLTIIFEENFNNDENRCEERINQPVILYLRPCANPFAFKREVESENISRHGAMIICQQPYQIGAHLEISSLSGSLTIRAQARHCRLRKDGRWSIGLKFIIITGKWLFPEPE